MTPLNLPPPNSPYGRVTGLLVANPGVWVTHRQIAEALGGTTKTIKNPNQLVKKGYAEKRGGRGETEYRLKATPRVADTPRNLDRGRPRNASRPPSGLRPISPERQAEKEAAAAQRQADLNAIARDQAATLDAVRADLRAHPGSTAAAIAGRLHLTISRVRGAINVLAEHGQTVRTGGEMSAGTYRLLAPNYPTVTPRMTADARRVLAHLQTRKAETELGLCAELRLSREAVVCALAHLDGLGRIEWSGVGHLLLYRTAGQRRAA